MAPHPFAASIGCRDLLATAYLVNGKLDVARCRVVVGIGKGRHSAKPRNRSDQDFLPFAVKLSREQVDAGNITIGSRYRGHDRPRPNRP